MRNLVIALALVLFGGVAAAQPAKGGGDAKGSGKVKVYDFFGAIRSKAI